MNINPWDVKSFDEFLFYMCPECQYFTKEEETLKEHANEVHSENFTKIKSEPIDDLENVTEVFVKEEPLDEVGFAGIVENVIDTNIGEQTYCDPLNHKPQDL